MCVCMWSNFVYYCVLSGKMFNKKMTPPPSPPVKLTPGGLWMLGVALTTSPRTFDFGGYDLDQKSIRQSHRRKISDKFVLT